MRRVFFPLRLLLLTIIVTGVPAIATAQVLATVPEDQILIDVQPGQSGQNNVWAISEDRFDTMRAWDPDLTPLPLTADRAIRIGQTWLTQHNPAVKTWVATDTKFLRILRLNVPSLRWYYRLVLRPEGASSAGDAIVVVLLDGTVVEPSLQKASPVLVAGTKDVYRAGNGVTEPKAVKKTAPKYPAEALRARVEGSVVVECVVNTNGKVGDAKVAQSLDKVFGLDAEAVKTVRQWRFNPGTLSGKPVKVVVRIPVAFKLASRR